MSSLYNISGNNMISTTKENIDKTLLRTRNNEIADNLKLLPYAYSADQEFTLNIMSWGDWRDAIWNNMDKGTPPITGEWSNGSDKWTNGSYNDHHLNTKSEKQNTSAWRNDNNPWRNGEYHNHIEAKLNGSSNTLDEILQIRNDGFIFNIETGGILYGDEKNIKLLKKMCDLTKEELRIQYPKAFELLGFK